MSEISELIFNKGAHKLTSPFGKREIIDTKSGTTSPFHNGADYGTFSKKLPQYAISSGDLHKLNNKPMRVSLIAAKST